MSPEDKIKETADALLSYIHNGVQRLAENGSSSDAKNYISALKSLVDIIGNPEFSTAAERTLEEGLKEFFGDLNDSDSKTKRNT